MPDIKIGSHDLIVNLKHDLSEIRRYGDWTEGKTGQYLIPGYLSGSDYNGTLVERSNERAFTEQFSDGEDKWWTSVFGGHGTFAIVIDTKNIPEEIEEDVAEFLNKLHDYPLADEDLHSEMEMEAQNVAWKEWAKKDFIKEIEKRFDIEFDNEPDDELVSEIFYKACDKANEYWINEQGDQAYIDLKKVVAKGMTQEDFKQLLADATK